MRFALILLAFLTLGGTSAHALMAAPEKRWAQYKCDPATLLLEQTKDGLRLYGALETPTPNYSYEILDKDGPITLVMKSAGGMSVMMIGTLEIDHVFEDKGQTQLDIAIEKDFNWGPERITCNIVG